MTLAIPTTAELRDNIVAGIESTLGQTVPLLPKAFIRVLASVLAGVLVTLYRYGGFTFQQQFPQTATIEPTVINGVQVQPLVALGRLVGLDNPSPGTQAEVSIDVTVNTIGTLPAGTQFQHIPSGVVYITVASQVITTPTTSITVRAASDQSGGGGFGTIGNRVVGDILSSVNPVAAIGTDAPVDAIVTTGVDAETESEYRQRVLDRWQFRPQGGAYADYREWSVEVEGIINAYPYTSDEPGQVNVYVESGTETDGIPTVDQINLVRQSIELDDANFLATRRPAGALVNVFGITRTGFDVTVVGLEVENEPQVTTDLTTALTEYFLSREPYIVGVTLPPRKDQITQTGVAGVVEDVVTAAGGTFTSVEVGPSLGSPITNYSLSEGEKTKLTALTV